MKVSPLFLLFLVFLVLKLCDVITSPWWLVTLPLWGPLVIVAVVVFVCFTIGVLCVLCGITKGE